MSSVKIESVIAKLPKRNEEILIKKNQNDKDIVTEILIAHEEFKNDYDRIIGFFNYNDICVTCEELWYFLKDNLKYHAESVHDQTVRSPYRILKTGSKVDCKHYSLFIAGVLDSLKRNVRQNEDWSWTYRFASYNREKIPAHVFVVVNTDEGEIWIDPVLNSDDNYRPNWFKDKKVDTMALYKLSGIDTINYSGNEQVVFDSDIAVKDFLIWVEKDLFNIRALLRYNPGIVNNEVKQWFASNGFSSDFVILKRLLSV